MELVEARGLLAWRQLRRHFFTSMRIGPGGYGGALLVLPLLGFSWLTLLVLSGREFFGSIAEPAADIRRAAIAGLLPLRRRR